MKYKKEWAQVFRNILSEQMDMNEEKYTDEEILIITKGTMAPELCRSMNITTEWMYDLYWYSMMTIEPNEILLKSLDIDVGFFKNRAEDNTN